jgi:hypothetical protein
VKRLQVGETTLDFCLQRSLTQTELEITAEGLPVTLTFEPEVPLGSTDLHATKNGQALLVTQLSNAQDRHARVELNLSGRNRIVMHYTGGLTPEVDWQPPAIGEVSRNLRLRGAGWSGQTYTADLAIAQGTCPNLLFYTAARPVAVQGGTVVERSPELFALRIPGNDTNCNDTPGAYRDVHLELRFAAPQSASR